MCRRLRAQDVLVHQASGTELGLVETARAEYLLEPTLVVVVSVLFGVVDSSDVDNNVKRGDWG